MAGINFYIEYREGERSLIKGLLTFLQQRAKSWKLEFRFNHDRSQYEVDMHGHLQDIQAFIVFINSSDTLQTYAAAFPQPNKPQTRLRAARRVNKKIIESVEEISDMVFQVGESLEGFPNSYFFETDNLPEVELPVISFTGILILYHNGFINSTPVIEAAHTAIETILKILVGDEIPQGTKNRFQKMVVRAVEKGYLQENSVDTINKFNSMRTEAKHDGRNIEANEIQPVLPVIIESTHSLIAAIHKLKIR